MNSFSARRLITAAAVVSAASVAGIAAGHADERVYCYRVEHPRYGDIGTYTNVIKQTGDSIEVDTNMHIAVKFLGITLFHEEAVREELWRDNRLVSFQGWTNTNGKKINITGEARGDQFVITSNGDTEVAPADVHPSNPWSPSLLTDSKVVMSTRTGKVMPAQVLGGDYTLVNIDGSARKLRQFEIDTAKRQFVWFDEHGVPVAFRSLENGTPVDFVLTDLPSSG